MDNFMTGLPVKRKPADESTPNVTTTKTKTRKYDKAYLALGFISTTVGNKEWTQCDVCLKILASDIVSVSLLKCRAQQSHFIKAASVPSNASYKVPYGVGKSQKLHTIEELIPPSSIDLVSTMIKQQPAH